MRSGKEIIEYLKKRLGTSKDKLLAEDLDITANTIKMWKHTNKVNFEVLLKYAIRKKIDLNDLFTGEIEFYKDEYPFNQDEKPLMESLGSNQVFKLKDDLLFQNTEMPSYDSSSSIVLDVPFHIPTIYDRFWIVPDERMSPEYRKGDILIIQQDRTKICPEGTLAIFSGMISKKQSLKAPDSEFVLTNETFAEGVVLGYGYLQDQDKVDGESHNIVEQETQRIRVASLNPEYSDLFIDKYYGYFRILSIIRRVS